MELLKPNFVDTTTAFTVQSNTATAAYLFERDPVFQYVSSGYANDLTTTSIVVSFAQTTSVSRVALVGHNLKDFRVFYNGVTANTFALTSTGATTASAFTSNSETSLYLQATPVNCTSVTIDMRKTITADSEKAVGYLVISDVRMAFDAVPSAKGYKIKLDPKDVRHELSDGGMRIQTVNDTYQTELKLSYISASFRNTLRSIYDLHDEHIFVPFGTTTGWDAVIFPCVWDGPFEFYAFADNNPSAGFEGKLKLVETPR